MAGHGTLATLSISITSFLLTTAIFQIASASDPGEITNQYISFSLYSRNHNGTNLTHQNLYILEPRLPTVFLIHGWSANGNTTFLGEAADAFLEKDDYNIIVVDYREIASQIYTTAVSLANDIAKIISDLIVDMNINYGIRLDTMEVAGHSLGAHISGYIGRFVQNSTGSQIGRLTGLDPAGPFFYNLTHSTQKIAKGDGARVVCIHTDTIMFGTSSADCDIDFFPNGGLTPQPGCPLIGDLYCSHGRSTELYIEAIRNPDGFLSTKCDAWIQYIDYCDLSQNVTMGRSHSVSNNGSYYLRTNSESPYSKE